jgi:LacI family transcriptional regulator
MCDVDDGPVAAGQRQVRAGLAGHRTPSTLQDVAREAGVSIATASRALNGSVRNVRAENVSRVLAAAARLHYQPHLSAQAIARGSTRTTALVVADVDDPYFSSIAAGVIQASEEAGLIVTMAVTARSPQRELEIVRALRGRRPHAIIIVGSRVDATGIREALVEELDAYQTTGGRVVLVSQPDLPFHSVAVDNFGGARQLATALVDIGYRRFAMIAAPDRIQTSRDRRTGFAAGLRRSRIAIEERFMLETEFTRAGGYAAAGEIVERGLDGVELVFAVNDVMAIGAMTALRDLGVVPGLDVAVAGFDDVASAVDVVPALTSVVVPLPEVGANAVRLALTGGDDAVSLPVATTVVLRDSTPPRNSP